MLKVLNEERVLNFKKLHTERPLSDSDVIRVYHGFHNMEHVYKTLTRGISGKMVVPRVYSYEQFNNPTGLFVSISLNVAKSFASSGVVIEFASVVKDLEAPVWSDDSTSDGGMIFTPRGFADGESRSNANLKNRRRASDDSSLFVSNSDRPELAYFLQHNREHQALFVGDLDPNMIKAVWFNPNLSTKWTRYEFKQILKILKKDLLQNKIRGFDIGYKANDMFTLNDFKQRLEKKFGKTNKYMVELMFNTFLIKRYTDRELFDMNFFPKQIQQIKKIYNELDNN